MEREGLATFNVPPGQMTVPLAKADPKQAYDRIIAIVSREMREYTGMSVEDSIRQQSGVVLDMIKNSGAFHEDRESTSGDVTGSRVSPTTLSSGVCPETGKVVSFPLGKTVWNSPDCPPTTSVEKMLSGVK
jgi:hypothetical protein